MKIEKKDNNYITLDIIYSTVENPQNLSDEDFPIQLMSFVVKDKYPYDKCKTFLDVIRDNIFGEILSHNITPIKEMHKTKLLSQIETSTTVH
tara:strand:- start:201 stop:476 length:276 start_codon:yes stop_codon:yes gene_type:complete